MNNMKTLNNQVMENMAHGAGRSPVSASTEPMVASYLTHELRAPLTSIRSALSLLQENLASSLMPDQNQLLTLAVKNTERLSSLINDILDFNKIQLGKMKLDRQPLYARSLIQEAVDSMSAWAISKRIKLLRVSEDEPLPRALADSRRVVQVLINLISNAIKFTPAGGKIQVSAALGNGEHFGTIVFSVKDSGCGIPPTDLDRVFHCFEQSSTGVKSGEGTGLGLTLARAMVELHGGRIWAESWRGLGSTFRFSIPITPEDQVHPVELYSKPTQYHGILVNVFHRLNAFIAAFV
jgi:signal transduction histidine kinase